jgi:hypothetical protein
MNYLKAKEKYDILAFILHTSLSLSIRKRGCLKFKSGGRATEKE